MSETATDVYTEETFYEELLPSVLEAYVAHIVRSYPDELKAAKTFSVIVPTPRSLFDGLDAVVDGVTPENIQTRLPAPFNRLLVSASPYPDTAIRDDEGEVIFDLLMQDMRAICFEFRVPRGVFEADE